MSSNYFCLITCLIVSFSKTWLRWKSAHSTAASAQTENESKSLDHWRSCAARLEIKEKSQGCFFKSLTSPIIISIIYLFILLNVSHWLFFLLLFLCISISCGRMFPSSPTAESVLEKVDRCSASQTAGWKFSRVFGCAPQSSQCLPILYPYHHPNTVFQPVAAFEGCLREVFRINTTAWLLTSLPDVPPCEEEDRRSRIARQHYYQHLMVRW